MPFLREEAVRGGVTTVRTQAGWRAFLSGVGAVLRVDPGTDVELLQDEACVAAAVGVTRGGKRGDVFDRQTEVDRLVALIEKGKRYAEASAKYDEELAEWEEAIAEKEKELEDDFKKAKKKREKEMAEAEEKGKEFKEDKYKEDKKPKKPKYDAADEVMARVWNGELPLVVEVHGSPQIRSLLAKTEDFDRLRLVLAGGSEAHHLAEELVERRIPVIVWPAPLGAQAPDEYGENDLGRAGQLARAGGDGPHRQRRRGTRPGTCASWPRWRWGTAWTPTARSRRSRRRRPGPSTWPTASGPWNAAARPTCSSSTGIPWTAPRGWRR